MFPSHLSVNDLGVFAVVMVFGLIVVLLFMFDWRGVSKGPSIPGEEPSDSEMGNLGDVGKAGSLHEYLMLLHEKYGSIAGFWWGKKYVVSLAAPEHWKDVQPLFDRPPEMFKLFEPLIGKKSIQYVNGPEGRKRRQMMDRSFSHDAVKDYYEHFVKIAKETADKFAKCGSEEHIPLAKNMIAMAVKAISVAGMGRIFMDEKEIDKLTTIYDVCWGEMEARLTGPPPDKDSEREKKIPKRADFHNLVKEIIKRRRQDDDKAEKLIIDSILDCDFMDEEETCDQVITFIVGGFHTTGNMMTWCLYYLTKHPEIQEKVFAELEEVLGDEDIKPQVASELKYTRQVIDETLRASVLAPWGARVHEYDLQVDEFVIPKETPIITPFGVVLQDPNLWPEPRRFDPDRFSPENIKQLPSLAYQPFGFAGKRKCPGWRFSIAEGLVFLSVLIKRFKFHLVEGQDVKPHHGLVTSPAEEVWVTVTER
ncbi:cytochrome P450 20A1-like [Oculina patagonica]